MRPLSYYYITLPYGARRSYWVSPTHTGTDLRASVGTDVFASSFGKVIHSGYGGYGSAYGEHVILRCTTPRGKTRHVLYAHLSSSKARVGHKVHKGEKIGKSGASGNVTAPHLHYEERVSPFGYWNHAAPVFIDGVFDKWRPKNLISLYNVRRHRKRAIKRIQNKLIDKYAHLAIRADGKWGGKTKSAYAYHQRQLGYKGNDANGEPGPTSLKALGFVV